MSDLPSYAELKPHYRGGVAVYDRESGIQLLPPKLTERYANKEEAGRYFHLLSPSNPHIHVRTFEEAQEQAIPSLSEPDYT